VSRHRRWSDRLFAAHGERFVPSVVWRLFERRAVSFKKNRARQRAGPARRDGRTRSMQALQPDIDIDRLVFIDETGASMKMARLYGRPA
jgi:hypothetical protein